MYFSIWEMWIVYKRDTILSWSSSYDTNWNKSFMKQTYPPTQFYHTLVFFILFSNWFQYLLQFDIHLKVLLQYLSIAHRIRSFLLPMSYKALHNLDPACFFDFISHSLLLSAHNAPATLAFLQFLSIPFPLLSRAFPLALSSMWSPCLRSSSANSHPFTSQLKYQALPDPLRLNCPYPLFSFLSPYSISLYTLITICNFAYVSVL